MPKQGSGWLYLATWLDRCSRKVVGWDLRETMPETLVSEALSRALAVRRPAAGLIVHSDQGSQYAATRFKALPTRTASHHSALIAVGLASVLSAPWHQPLAAERSRATSAEKRIQKLPHWLPARRFCGSTDRGGQAGPFCGHRPHQQKGLCRTASPSQVRGGGRIPTTDAEQTVLSGAQQIDR